MSDPKPTPSPKTFFKSVKLQRLGPVFTFAHGGTTYRVATQELLERALFDLFTQKASGKPWTAPGGKSIPPYNPMHETTPEFRSEVEAFLK